MKKGQAAMEFLMTYGWAILVVLAAIGALAYFGVLSPSKLLPSKCTLSPGMNFGDCKASAENLSLSIYNGLGTDIKDVIINVTTAVGATVSCNEQVNVLPNPLGNGATSSPIVMCAATRVVGDRFDADVNIIYTKVGETFTHTNSGKIQIKVER